MGEDLVYFTYIQNSTVKLQDSMLGIFDSKTVNFLKVNENFDGIFIPEGIFPLKEVIRVGLFLDNNY